MEYEKYMRRAYELAVSAGKKGFETFGAVLVHDGEILEEAENTHDWQKGVFGHAEYNLVHKCAGKYSDEILGQSTLFTSCAPCERCLCAIASLGIKTVVCGVGYKEFARLLPFEDHTPDYEPILKQMNVELHMVGPVLQDEGMHAFEYWGGEYHPLEELIAEMDEIKRSKKAE